MHLPIPDKRAALLGLTLFSAKSLAVCNGADNARVSVDSLDEGSPVYSASLLQKESTPVRGTMTVASAMNSIGVDVTLMLTGLPGPDEEGYVTLTRLRD
ncbi:hypothetical protein KEM55_008882 [Ascosphaera atra]|nr:hypothetical protein KEM55_008882 [Ascosphaera atra]